MNINQSREESSMTGYQEYEFHFTRNGTPADTPEPSTADYIQFFWHSGEALRTREVNSILDCAVYLFPNNVFAMVTMAGDAGYLTVLKKADTQFPRSIAGFLMDPSQKAEFAGMRPSALHPSQAYARQPCEDSAEETLGQLFEPLRKEYLRDLEHVVRG